MYGLCENSGQGEIHANAPTYHTLWNTYWTIKETAISFGSCLFLLKYYVLNTYKIRQIEFAMNIDKFTYTLQFLRESWQDFI